MLKIDYDFQSSQDRLNYEELWENLANAATHIKDDNKLYLPHEGIPQNIRERQLISIKSLIEEIELCHNINRG